MNRHLAKDGLQNLVTGMGTRADKATYTEFLQPLITSIETNAAYRSSWIARKIIDIVPEDMTREWREWQAEPETITKLEDEEKRLKLQKKITDAIRWARLTGGAALIMGVNDGSSSEQPLDIKRVEQGGFKWLHVLPKTRLSRGEIEDDIEHPNYGNPRSFTIASAKAQITFHHSRVITFHGADLPPDMQTDGWGESILVAVYESMRNAATVSSVMGSLLHEAKVDVITVPGLSQHLATKAGEDRLKERFATAALMKSLHNILMLGDGEIHDTKHMTFAGLPDIHIRFMQEAAGAADIPLTRMLGQSPAGLNATGESDLRMYYDMIASLQNDELRTALDRIDPILMRSALGADHEEIFYEFRSLWQMAPETKAEINSKNALSFQHDVNSGVFGDEELRRARTNQIIETEAYPGFEQILKDTEAEGKSWEDEPDEPLVMPGQPQPGQPQPGQPQLKLVGKDASPRTLYVRRNVMNSAEVLGWARKQGIPNLLDGNKLHVTIAFSRQPVDWMKMGGYPESEKIIINEGGPRLVERLGDNGDALVLMFANWELTYRHGQMREAGASWDWPEFQPHITISYKAKNINEKRIEPYRGKIVLGPEIFEEVDEDWKAKVVGDHHPGYVHNPHHKPAGSPEGGQFTSGSGGGGSSTNPTEGSGQGPAREKTKSATPAHGTDPSTLKPDVVEVGGDEWNRQTALRLELEYQQARLRLEEHAKSVAVDESEASYDLGPPLETVENWKSSFLDLKKNDVLQGEIDNWLESEHAVEDAKHYVLDKTSDIELASYINEMRVETSFEDEPIREFPFDDETIAAAMKVEVLGPDDGIYDGGKFNIEFDETKLTEPRGWDPTQQTLPGIEPENPAKRLTEEMRRDIYNHVVFKMNEEAVEALDGGYVPIPDYLNDQANEYLEETWNGMSTDDQIEWAKVNGLLNENELSVPTVPPKTWKPFENGDDYLKTRAMAHAISRERAGEIIRERGLKALQPARTATAGVIGMTPTDVPAMDDPEMLAEIDNKLWQKWKDSSTSSEGIMIQIAVEEELGARGKTDYSGVPKRVYMEDADRTYGHIGGFEGVKALVRAKWEASQFVLDKAGVDELPVYRAMSIPGAREMTKEKVNKKDGFALTYHRLTDIELKRNGAQSTSADIAVPNDWGSDTNRVVLRALVPRTAILSFPAYGVNVHKEKEVVVTGTAWKGWDAWYGRAPRLDDLPLEHN